MSKIRFTIENLHNWANHWKKAPGFQMLPQKVKNDFDYYCNEHHKGMSARIACECLQRKYPEVLDFVGF